MATKKSGSKKRAKQRASDEAVSYDEFKEYEGQRYTGMKIGRSHSWNYDAGRWKERKITPDLWQISYAVTKRRAGRAPEGSGVPVGTEYHWYILAHQNVEKLNANDYTTSLAGLKFKVAHRRADSGKWSATPKTQRKRMIRFLRDVIEDLEAQADEEEASAGDAGTREPASGSAAGLSAAKKPVKRAARRSGAKKSAAKRSAAKKSAAKKSAAKKSAAKKSAAQKSAAQKSAAQKSAARKSAAE
jgi:hypothetical protein